MSTKFIFDGTVLLATTAFVAATMNVIARIFKAKTEDGKNAVLTYLIAALAFYSLAFGLFIVAWFQEAIR